MLYNCECTLLQDGKLYALPCWWEDAAGVNIQRYGVQNAHTAKVSTPIDKVKPKPESYMIKGVFAASTAKEMLQNGGLKVMAVDTFDFGSKGIRHYEVSLK